MADREFIKGLLAEAAFAVPYVSEQDLSGAVQHHSNAFRHIEPARLKAAFGEWVDRQTEDRPPKTLPAPSAIRRLLAPEKGSKGGPVRPERREKITKPRREFVAAHSAFKQWAESIQPREPVKHNQHDPEDEHPCPGCLNEDDREAMADMVRLKLESLPVPRGEDVTLGCRCGGDGVVYCLEDGSFAALPPEGYDREIPGSVPCPSCASEAHDVWMGYDEAKGSRKA